MKKFICALLCFVFILSTAACGGKTPDDGKETDGNKSTADRVSDKTVEDNTENTKTVGRTLVAYYSATGSTKKASETIAKELNAELFEIVPQTPYSSEDLNWNDSNSRVSIEHNDESKRNVPLAATTPDNWEQYDTVYIGYPIWWGIAAWPVNSFVTGNDFVGKTVIPFCTSASSGLGSSVELLKNAAGTGTWKDGKRFSSSASETDIKEWLDTIK